MTVLDLITRVTQCLCRLLRNDFHYDRWLSCLGTKVHQLKMILLHLNNTLANTLLFAALTTALMSFQFLFSGQVVVIRSLLLVCE
jgi:hypothetical protein